VASEVSAEQRAVIERLSNEGLRSPEIGKKIGLPTQVVAGIIAWLRNRDSWQKIVETTEGAVAAEVEGAVETATFGLERDLQNALRDNIDQLELGLKVIATEQSVASGRIDITAEDKDGATVVIELKAVEADRDAVAQLLAYIGDLMDDNRKTVRGILVAPSFSARAISAALAARVELKRYSFRFSFESANRTVSR
jgi:RecB family endonuclease NucS